MARESLTKEHLRTVGAGAHTYESFGRSLVAGALESAAERVEAEIGAGTTIELSDVKVTISDLGHGFVLTCVWLPEFGRICHLDRPDR
jgi:hypothetical protein